MSQPQAPAPPERLLTALEVAGRLAVSRTAVYALVTTKQLRALRLGRRSIRFQTGDVEDYLRARATIPNG